MRLLTGKKGKPHFTSMQFRAILETICGSGSLIANLYETLQPELVTNNVIKIRSGVLLHHGGVIMVEPGTYDEVTYMNGTQGMKRIDLIVARYTNDISTGVEESEWVVIQGTPAESDPVAPDYTVGNMQEGDLVDDCPVFEVHFDGINVTEIKSLLKVTTNINEIHTEISDMCDKIYPIGSIYMSANSTNPSTLFGGTWKAWGSGRVPVGVDTSQSEFNTVGKTGGAKTHALTTSEMPSHKHAGLYYNANNKPISLSTGSNGYRLAGWEGDAGTSGGSDISTGTVGNGGAHNNLQPYITCYMWVRTA